MATNEDTLSLVLLIVAIAATGLAACGALILGAQTLSRRWRARSPRAWRDSPTVQFRTPDPVDLIDTTDKTSIADPTDRFTDHPLFGAQAPAEDEPFGGDTVPVLEIEPLARAGAVADV
jgi:hypothetical protein